MVGIIDYGAGNTRSVINALKTIGADFVLTSDQTILRQADQIILPGVGHAGKAMERLSSAGLIDFILNCELPFLGICLGMQLMTSYSEEGNTPCFGLLDVSTDVFDGQKVGKVPHMGWNRMHMDRGNPLFEGIPEGSYMYFVHSYFVRRLCRIPLPERPIPTHSVQQCSTGIFLESSFILRSQANQAAECC
jgi:imidazole glycerol-phosphate synthase subunit HisH